MRMSDHVMHEKATDWLFELSKSGDDVAAYVLEVLDRVEQLEDALSGIERSHEDLRDEIRHLADRLEEAYSSAEAVRKLLYID